VKAVAEGRKISDIISAVKRARTVVRRAVLTRLHGGEHRERATGAGLLNKQSERSYMYLLYTNIDALQSVTKRETIHLCLPLKLF